VLQQRLEQSAAQPLALPRIGEHERHVCTGLHCVDDIAPNADELLGAVDRRGYGESHVAAIIDVRHRVDPLGRHLDASAQHALIAGAEGKAADERLLELAVVAADRPHEQRPTRARCPRPGQVSGIAR
jgi:hypothetical protein